MRLRERRSDLYHPTTAAARGGGPITPWRDDPGNDINDAAPLQLRLGCFERIFQVFQAGFFRSTLSFQRGTNVFGSSEKLLLGFTGASAAMRSHRAELTSFSGGPPSV